MRQHGFWQSFLVVVLSNLVARSIVAAEETMTAAYIGTSKFSDCYFLAVHTASLVAVMFGESAILKSFAPIYRGIRLTASPQECSERLSQYGILFCAIGFGLCGLMIAFSTPIAALSMSDVLQVDVASRLLKSASFYVALAVINGYLMSVYEAAGSFGGAQYLRALPIIGAMGGLLYFEKGGAFFRDVASSMIWGSNLCVLLQILINVATLRFKFGYKLGIVLSSMPRAEVATMLRAYFGAVMIGKLPAIITWINLIIVCHTPSAASYIHYAERIMMIVYIIVGAGIARILVSRYANAAAEDNAGEMRHLVGGAFQIVWLLSAPMMAIAFTSSKLVVNALLLRGEFAAEAACKTSSLVLIYMMSLFPRAMFSCLMSMYIAINKILRLWIIMAIAAALYVPSLLLMYRWFDYSGLIVTGTALFWLLMLSVLADCKYQGFLPPMPWARLSGAGICAALVALIFHGVMESRLFMAILAWASIWRGTVFVIMLMVPYAFYLGLIIMCDVYSAKDLRSLI